MNWDDLRFVLALSRHRTFSAAAKALGATHTTVSRRLRALEAAFETRLFGANGPTAAGQRVIEAAERTEALMHSLEVKLMGDDDRLEGKLRVTTMDILYRRYAHLFASFLERYPGVELTLSCNDREASLGQREADVALRMSNRPAGELVGRKVGRVEFAVYASRGLARKVGPRAPLKAWPWLHSDERGGWLDAWLAEHAPGARIALRVDVSSFALRELVASGVGVHFLACSEGDADARLIRISPIERAFTRELWLLTLAELKTSTRVRAFLDHFASATRSPSTRTDKRGS